MGHGEDLEKMKVNESGRYLGQGRNSWQCVKHAWLYSDLLQALNGEHLSALGSQQREHSFCIRSPPDWRAADWWDRCPSWLHLQMLVFLSTQLGQVGMGSLFLPFKLQDIRSVCVLTYIANCSCLSVTRGLVFIIYFQACPSVPVFQNYKPFWGVWFCTSIWTRVFQSCPSFRWCWLMTDYVNDTVPLSS